MNTLEFLSFLEIQRVHVWADGGKLRYRAENGELETGLRSELAHRKSDILKVLRKRSPGSSMPRLTEQQKKAGVPLSYAQQALWFAQQLEPDSPAYNVPIALRLTGPLDSALLERSIAEVIGRHEILRSSFHEVDGELRQVIHDTPTFQLTVEPVFAATAADRAQAAGRVVGEAARRALDLTQPPCEIRLLRLESECHVLFVNMHHLDDFGRG